MSLMTVLAKSDRMVRPLLARVHPHYSVKLYSAARSAFIHLHGKEVPAIETVVPPELGRTLWGIHFRSPIFNAAGMYKNGEGYAFCGLAGAGAYLAGTTTSSKRKGNTRNNVRLPFAPYPQSRAASNWLGLPNGGHSGTAKILAGTPRIAGCPIGVSVAFEPKVSHLSAIAGLIEGLELYQKANVDFIELNESCPNTGGQSQITTYYSLEELFTRLDDISRRFLRQRRRTMPIIVKFSNDTSEHLVPIILDALTTMGYDGVNFGNTSTDYAYCKTSIASTERPVFDYFTKTYGGGVSGKPLSVRSLGLTRAAASALAHKPPRNEFHIIRTGGVETAADIKESLEAGASLAEWFTGYFDNLSLDGWNIYSRLYNQLQQTN